MDSLGINMTGDSAGTQYCFPHLERSCPQSQTFIIIKAAMYMFMAFSILMTVCGNLLVIISISHFKQLHSPTNLLVLSLACIDWFLGAVIMPGSMIRTVENCWYYGEAACIIFSSFDMMMSIASILHLCLISVDRYCAICKPFWYRSSVTMQKVACVIVIIWTFSFGFGFGVFLSNFPLADLEEFVMASPCVGNCVLVIKGEWGVGSAVLSFFVPGIVMTSLYLKIFYVARSHARKINDSLALTGAVYNHKDHMSEQREKKAAKTLGIVMGVFLLCWLPFFLTVIIETLHHFPNIFFVLDLLLWLGYLNSTCNPLIYGFFYSWFQTVFKMIISGKVFHSGSSSFNIGTDHFK
ncbi:trace amine-associated receptor 3-like [Anguilla rostrata]|uniref:trace amine-associated receptor 3-like n=1 Tax=Anguilla rostrata TaxID=7938 RepID=UPI0030CBA7BA